MSTILTGREVHPVLPILSPEQEEALRTIGAPQQIEEYYAARKEVMLKERLDPFRNGYEPPSWKMVDAQVAELREKCPVGVVESLLLGGNRGGKSEYAAKRIVELIVRKPEARVWCLQSTQSISRQSQQPLIWKYLPPEWKPVSGRGKRDVVQKMNYTQAGGFTEDTFVLPNGSQCFFKFYSVALTSVEGPELDAGWSDELVTPEWLEFLRYRLVTRNGHLLTTFTPVEGYSATVKTYLDRAKTLEEVDAELLPNRNAAGEIVSYEKVPRIQQSGIERARIVYFHTKDNPYGNYPSMVETLRGKSRETVLMRAYGVPSKTFGAALPLFRESVHVISLNRFGRFLQDFPNPTRFHLVDPCSGRNWFQIWVACFPNKKAIIYREWPSYGHSGAYIQGIADPGPWTMPGEPSDGLRGPAQSAFGFGLDRYVSEIKQQETNEKIEERWMDCRSGNLPTATREGTTTLIEQLAELGMDFLPSASEKSIFNNNDGSLDMINSALYYDQDVSIGDFSKSLARINEPELLVLETCPNVIYSMSNWTGKDGQQGACKDPIDTVRMFYLSELGYVDQKSMAPRQPWMSALGR